MVQIHIPRNQMQILQSGAPEPGLFCLAGTWNPEHRAVIFHRQSFDEPWARGEETRALVIVLTVSCDEWREAIKRKSEEKT